MEIYKKTTTLSFNQLTSYGIHKGKLSTTVLELREEILLALKDIITPVLQFT